LVQVWDRHHEEHPSIAALRRAPGACHRLSEQVSLSQLRKLPIYSMFMQPLGGRDQLTVALQADNRRLVGLTLARLDGRFTDRERQFLEELAGPLRHLYTAVRANETARLLTDGQARLLRLVADGYTDAAIARRLGVSQRTVEKHLEGVRTRLRVGSRSAAVASWLGW
jgi:DNA-binding CsgD family transcriptional regulator